MIYPGTLNLLRLGTETIQPHRVKKILRFVLRSCYQGVTVNLFLFSVSEVEVALLKYYILFLLILCHKIYFFVRYLIHKSCCSMRV